jgi:hypothetical protein
LYRCVRRSHCTPFVQMCAVSLYTVCTDVCRGLTVHRLYRCVQRSHCTPFVQMCAEVSLYTVCTDVCRGLTVHRLYRCVQGSHCAPFVADVCRGLTVHRLYRCVQGSHCAPFVQMCAEVSLYTVCTDVCGGLTVHCLYIISCMYTCDDTRLEGFFVEIDRFQSLCGKYLIVTSHYLSISEQHLLPTSNTSEHTVIMAHQTLCSCVQCSTVLWKQSTVSRLHQ